MNPTLIFNKLVAGQRAKSKKKQTVLEKEIKLEITKLQELADTITRSPELVFQIKKRLDELSRNVE